MARKKVSRSQRLINSFERWYYNLSFGIRHFVGLMLLCLVLGTTASIIYGGYRLISYGCEWVADVWHRLTTDDDVTDYSNDQFILTAHDQHPDRTPKYDSDFSYNNDVHLSAASRLGIQPQPDRAALERMKGELVEIHNCKYYQIMELTHSQPFLVPRAAAFLDAVGQLMQQYNGTKSRFYISSVLRTQADVKRLNKVNINASKNSAHCYGTTIDIAYTRFDIAGDTTSEQLKIDLARALYDLQAKGYCYVKHEKKQACFHITVRPR